jgi:hypothetical protein
MGSGGVSADPQATATLDGAPLFFAHPAPDAGVLTGLEGPLQALVGHGAPPADGLGLLDLQKRRAGRPDREEQLRVFIAAGSMVAPVHGGNTPRSGSVTGNTFLFPICIRVPIATLCDHLISNA